jgi:hypothetical protein
LNKFKEYTLTKELNKNLKNKNIHINSPISENLLYKPESYIKNKKIPNNKKIPENFSLTNQHIQEIYKIKTTIPLI